MPARRIPRRRRARSTRARTSLHAFLHQLAHASAPQRPDANPTRHDVILWEALSMWLEHVLERWSTPHVDCEGRNGFFLPLRADGRAAGHGRRLSTEFSAHHTTGALGLRGPPPETALQRLLHSTGTAVKPYSCTTTNKTRDTSASGGCLRTPVPPGLAGCMGQVKPTERFRFSASVHGSPPSRNQSPGVARQRQPAPAAHHAAHPLYRSVARRSR